MRVSGIVGEPLEINTNLTRKEIRTRVAELLEEVGLAPYQADLFPHEFSGGQRQRIGVARALALNPKLVILDEPVSALDVSIRAQIMNLLKDLQTEHNLSYLLIAHHLATVRHMCDKVGVMYLGRIVEEAETEELYENPLHPYTRALMSAALPSHPDIQRDEIILTGEGTVSGEHAVGAATSTRAVRRGSTPATALSPSRPSRRPDTGSSATSTEGRSRGPASAAGPAGLASSRPAA